MKPVSIFFSFFFTSSRDHRDLHSFPTRRSSDLAAGKLFKRRPQSLAGVPLAVFVSQKDHRKFYVQLASLKSRDRKSTRLNSSHQIISYAVFCLKKKNRPQGLPPQAPRHDEVSLP